MKKKTKESELMIIYNELKTINELYKIEQEALYLCYEENKDYGHVFALDTIFSDKFKKILENFEKYLSNV